MTKDCWCNREPNPDRLNAGLLIIPDETSFSEAAVEERYSDSSFEEEQIEAMMKPILDRSEASGWGCQFWIVAPPHTCEIEEDDA